MQSSDANRQPSTVNGQFSSSESCGSSCCKSPAVIEASRSTDSSSVCGDCSSAGSSDPSEATNSKSRPAGV